MRRKSPVALLIACCASAILLSSCASTAESVLAPGSIDTENGYIAMYFSGPDLDVRIVELTEREGMLLHLRDSPKLQLVPVRPGDWAVYHLGGSEFTLRGQIEYTYHIPRPMMRVIRVRPGRVVYIGQIDVPRTARFATILGGTFEYSYDYYAATAEFRERFDTDGAFDFVGMIE